jgi:pantoate--beta-alanine ligase
MTRCLIGLGSNIGDRLGNLAAALAALRAEQGVQLISASSFHQTAPVGGPPNQGPYLNGAAVVDTTLEANVLLARLHAIEDKLGRVRHERFGPRTIDLDLLLFGDAVLSTPELEVPHPRMAERRFVLAPAAEIAGDLVHPRLGRTIRDLLTDLPAETGQHAQPFRVFVDPSRMQGEILNLRRQGRRLGLVPTMGALHAGHLSLVTAARQMADVVVATIFVNPTQFGPNEDFARYPRTLEADLQALAQAGCDVAFVPDREAVYPEGFSTFVEPPAVATPLEGRHRPGHFRGVATIVLKLFGMVPADVACFGQKDYQQALVIRRMARDLNVPTQIAVCPIVRDPDGLALSSRNRYLSPSEREQALAISRGLRCAEELVGSGIRDAEIICREVRGVLEGAGIDRIDHVALADAETLAELRLVDRPAVLLIAAMVGGTRLIDNCLLQPGA